MTAPIAVRRLPAGTYGAAYAEAFADLCRRAEAPNLHMAPAAVAAALSFGLASEDVVAATKVYGYEAGQDTDAGLLPRPESLSTSFPLHQRAQLLAEDHSWAEGLEGAPRVFHRPIASGSKVITGNASAAAEHINRHSSDAQAVDTESYGAMAAADRRRTVDAIVVRGISDLLGDKTKEADKLRQPTAARNAAAFSLALIGRSKPKQAEIRKLGPGRSNTYIGAVGNGANANIAAMGDNAHGRITIDYRK